MQRLWRNVLIHTHPKNKFVRNYADIIHALTNYLKQNVNWHRSKIELDAFDEIRYKQYNSQNYFYPIFQNHFVYKLSRLISELAKFYFNRVTFKLVAK